MLLATVPAPAQTRAGTAIVNVATVYRDGAPIPSNSVTTTVAERLDVTLARSPDDDTVLASGDRAVAVTLVNRGNGDEAFAIAASVGSGSAMLPGPVIAATAGSPMPLVDGRTPALPPGAALLLLVPVPVPSVASGTVLAVDARAVTGSGAAGTVLAGAGDGGGDAVVGPTGAAARLTISLAGSVGGDAAPTLEKSQAVRAPAGSARAIRGAAITYTLVARFAAGSAAAEIVDPIPAGTTYAPGSLSLDGAPLADAGHVAAGQIAVPLGAVAAGAARTLRFTVVIL